ncbi:MAG: hypothetical protein KAH48_02950, partial [Chlorobi bacterium]|nr:hypothetical protein [Chlorobiota bacterium]
EQTPNTKYVFPNGEVSQAAKIVVPAELGMFDQKDTKNKTQEIEYKIFDSLANGFSYMFQMTNKAFAYDITTGNLITAKRGFHDVLKSKWQFYEGDNTLYNIFARTSPDNGYTWDEAIPLYIRAEEDLADARYPSCYGFDLEGSLAIAYTFPTLNYVPGAGSEWWGFLTGMHMTEDDSRYSYENFDDVELENVDLKWNTDSRILAGVKAGTTDEYYIVAVSELSLRPEDEQMYEESSNIGIRRTENLFDDEWTEEVPDAWRSTLFTNVGTVGSRINQMVALKKNADDDMFLAVYGNFLANREGLAEYQNRYGVSKSSDYGATWADYEVVPPSVFSNYAVAQGWADGDLYTNNYNTRDFVVLDNGDYSFMTQIVLSDGMENSDGRIVEIYRESGEWGIRDIAGYLPNMVYEDYKDAEENRDNPSDIELQAARTVDGSAIIAKWVSIEGYDPDAGTFQYTDVHVAFRKTNSNKWEEPINVTDDEFIDRTTFIPDYVPNDLKRIPLMSMIGWIENDPDTGEEWTEREAQFRTMNDQYLRIGHFDAIVGIEDETH